MSAKYTPPGSKVVPKMASRPRINPFITVKETPPDTSSSDLFPELGGGNGKLSPSTPTPTPMATSTPPPISWGKIAQLEQPSAPKITPRTIPKNDIDPPVIQTKHKVIDVDPSFAINAMYRRKREAAELNSLNGYRDDYIYLHELDELECGCGCASDSEYDSDLSD